MWGVRVIRVGVLLGGLLAAIASAGCCECCKNLWGGEKAVPVSESRQPAVLNNDASELRPVEGDWHRGGRFQDQPPHLTAERVQGGIY
jgi:hypothetical protein